MQTQQCQDLEVVSVPMAAAPVPLTLDELQQVSGAGFILNE